MRDLHRLRAVWRGLHQHRNLQPGKPNRIDNGPLLAEIRKRDDDAVDFLGVLLEEFGAVARIIRSLHCSMLRLLRRKHDGFVSVCIKNRDDLFAAFFCKMVRKKSPAADNHSKRKLLLHLSPSPTALTMSSCAKDALPTS